MSRKLIRCNSVSYRKGYIEVLGDIHPGCINIEAWNIDPEVDITGLYLGDEDLPDDCVLSNSELEIPIEKAEDLVQQLVAAIKVAREKAN